MKEEEVVEEVEREGGKISGNLRRRDAISTCIKTEYCIAGWWLLPGTQHHCFQSIISLKEGLSVNPNQS